MERQTSSTRTNSAFCANNRMIRGNSPLLSYNEWRASLDDDHMATCVPHSRRPRMGTSSTCPPGNKPWAIFARGGACMTSTDLPVLVVVLYADTHCEALGCRCWGRVTGPGRPADTRDRSTAAGTVGHSAECYKTSKFGGFYYTNTPTRNQNILANQHIEDSNIRIKSANHNLDILILSILSQA